MDKILLKTPPCNPAHADVLTRKLYLFLFNIVPNKVKLEGV